VPKHPAASLLFVCVFLCSCGTKELTRSKAKHIIESSDLYELKQQRVPITRNEAIDLVARNYCAWQGIGVAHLILMPAGKQYFTSVSGEAMISYNPFTSPLIVVPIKPLRPTVVEITGITGIAIDSKVVEYKWKWESDGQPEEIKQILPSLVVAHEEKVVFKLYDDGWRAQFAQ
jgi:hypothetical protein